MSGFKNHARKHGKLTPQMERDMEEIEGMMEGMNSFGDKMNENIENLGKKAGLGNRNKKGRYEFDD